MRASKVVAAEKAPERVAPHVARPVAVDVWCIVALAVGQISAEEPQLHGAECNAKRGHVS